MPRRDNKSRRAHNLTMRNRKKAENREQQQRAAAAEELAAHHAIQEFNARVMQIHTPGCTEEQRQEALSWMFRLMRENLHRYSAPELRVMSAVLSQSSQNREAMASDAFLRNEEQALLDALASASPSSHLIFPLFQA